MLYVHVVDSVLCIAATLFTITPCPLKIKKLSPSSFFYYPNQTRE